MKKSIDIKIQCKHCGAWFVVKMSPLQYERYTHHYKEVKDNFIEWTNDEKDKLVLELCDNCFRIFKENILNDKKVVEY